MLLQKHRREDRKSLSVIKYPKIRPRGTTLPVMALKLRHKLLLLPTSVIVLRFLESSGESGNQNCVTERLSNKLRLLQGVPPECIRGNEKDLTSFNLSVHEYRTSLSSAQCSSRGSLFCMQSARLNFS